MVGEGEPCPSCLSSEAAALFGVTRWGRDAPCPYPMAVLVGETQVLEWAGEGALVPAVPPWGRGVGEIECMGGGLPWPHVCLGGGAPHGLRQAHSGI